VQLPGDYARPRGRLLLALGDDVIAGMVALRPIDETTGEVKRLYVRPNVRGQGIGRSLVTTLVEQAHTAGYSALRLETLEVMRDAQALYRALGFTEIAPYRPPTSEHDRTISMELAL